MSSGFNIKDTNSTTDSTSTKKGVFNKDLSLPGKITQTIGRGDDARNSFVFITLRWAFVIGIILTVLIALNNWCFKENDKVPDLMGDVTTAWEIVVPLITLALGYAFGKSKD